MEEARHALERLLKEAKGFEVFEIPEVLAGDREAGAGEAERVLLLGSAGEDFGFAAAEEDRLRGVAARAADRHRLASNDADDGVIDAGVDAAVVVDENVGDAGEAFFRFRIVNDDGFFADVAAGHDERGLGVPALAQDAEEEVMHRGAGKHDSRRGITGRDGFSEIHIRPAAQQDDGAFAADEGGAFLWRDEAEGLGDGFVGDHDGEGLFAAVLAAAEFFDGHWLARIAGELVAAESFPRDDAAGVEDVGDAFKYCS